MEIDVSNSKDVEITVVTHDSLTSGEITINGCTAPLEISGWFFLWTYSPTFDSTFTPLNPGDSISYTLKVNEKTYSGGMNLTYQPETTWPDTFDMNEDYTFTWTIPEEPDLYFCLCDVMYYNDTEEMNSWTFKGPRSQYNIAKKYYNDYYQIEDLLIYFATYNYCYFGSCIVYSIGLSEKHYILWKDIITRDRRMLRFKRLEMLLESIN